MTALDADTLGSRSTALGYAALTAQNFTTATNTYNTAVGFQAGAAVTTGTINTLIGGLAGDALTTGDSNVAMGYNALSGDTEGDRNVAVGAGALHNQNFTTTTDSYNVAVGYEAGGSISTGKENTLFGALSGDFLSDADFNTAVGFGSLSGDALGSRSTAIGYHALVSQNFTTATNANNVAVGMHAASESLTATGLTVVGYAAGQNISSGSNNTFIGHLSAANGTVTGTLNTAIGYASIYSLSSGSNNVALGRDSGRPGAPGGQVTTQSGQLLLGDENITNAHIQVSLTVASDERDKTDFVDLDLGLDFVKSLEPVTYYWDKRAKYLDRDNARRQTVRSTIRKVRTNPSQSHQRSRRNHYITDCACRRARIIRRTKCLK